jgi:hypothetical protein
VSDRQTSRTETDAVIALLEAVGLTVGDAVGETETGTKLTAPYVVVYPGSAMFDGPVHGQDDDASGLYQLTCVGSARQQAEWVRDEARDAFTTLTLADRELTQPPELEFSQGVRRDNDVEPPLFYAVDLYRVRSTPAAGS